MSAPAKQVTDGDDTCAIAGSHCGRLIGIGHGIREQDQHNAWRDDLTERSAGSNRAGREFGIVALLQHGRQRNQSHRDHRCANNARGGSEQGAHDHYSIAEAAAHPREQTARCMQQIIRDFRTLQDDAHQDKERDGNQDLIFHRSKNAAR